MALVTYLIYFTILNFLLMLTPQHKMYADEGSIVMSFLDVHSHKANIWDAVAPIWKRKTHMLRWDRAELQSSAPTTLGVRAAAIVSCHPNVPQICNTTCDRRAVK